MVRGKKRKLVEPKEIFPNIEINMPVTLHNRFDFETVNVITGEKKMVAQAENIILNALWTRLFTPAAFFGAIHFGTGTGVPAATDTQLFSFLGAKVVGPFTITPDYPNRSMSCRAQIQLSETEYVGSTLKEVGVGYDTTSTHLMTKALLKDMNNNPVSLLKTNVDIVNIYATTYVTWQDSFDNGKIKFYAHMWNTLLNPYLLIGSGHFGWESGMEVAIFCGSPSLTTYDSTPANRVPLTATPSYNAATRTITFTLPRMAAGVGNGVKGFRCMQLQGFASNNGTGLEYSCTIAWSFEVGGAWFPGTNIVAESIGTGDGVKKDFATQFGFVKGPSKVYVNGVEQVSGVTVDQNVPVDPVNMGRYFNWLPEKNVWNTASGRPGNPGDGWSRAWGPCNADYHPAGSASGSPGMETVFENLFKDYGIASFYSNYYSIQVSDDLITWTNLGTGSPKAVPVANRKARYWKLVGYDFSYSTCYCDRFQADTLTAFNIHFDVAPPLGAVITMDYFTETIAKDANHVFDGSFAITFGEVVV